MSAEQYDYLKRMHPHERDNHIQFDEASHVYTVDGDSDYVSVTTFNHAHFEAFDADAIIQKMMNSRNWNSNHRYYGKTPDEIKALWEQNRDMASSAGTKMHLDIERHYNQVEVNNTSVEFSMFMNFYKDFKHRLVPWRTEMTIWDKDYRIAGSVDMIFKSVDSDDLHIYDWKRCKQINKVNRFDKYSPIECISHLPDTNYWHYCLQLSTYKYILEKNYGKRVKDMYLVCLHPENTNNNYQRIKVCDLTEEVSQLLERRKLTINTHDSTI